MCESKQFGKILIRDEIAHFKIDLKSREQPIHTHINIEKKRYPIISALEFSYVFICILKKYFLGLIMKFHIIF